jgi:hypothetical protein
VLIEADDEQRHVITECFGPQCAAYRGRTPFESAEDQGGVRARETLGVISFVIRVVLAS